jgi:hypothetical protein
MLRFHCRSVLRAVLFALKSCYQRGKGFVLDRLGIKSVNGLRDRSHTREQSVKVFLCHYLFLKG